MHFYRKCWKSQVQFLPSEQPCKPKSLDFALNIAGVEKIRSENLPFRSTLQAINSKFMCSVVGDSQISCLWYRRLLQLQYRKHDLQRAILCSLLCTDTDWKICIGKQGYVFLLTDFKKRCFDVSFLASICVNNQFETENILNKLMS